MNGQNFTLNCFASIPWTATPGYSLNLPNGFNVGASTISNGTVNYDTLVINSLDLSTNTSESITSYNLVDIITTNSSDNSEGDTVNGNTSSTFSIEFPGWDIAEFKSIDENGLNGYYPSLKSNGSLTRSQPEALYLILQNLTTGERTVLDTYASGPQNSLTFTWQNPCENIRPLRGMH